jgi:RNA recognition motif-containing protein
MLDKHTKTSAGFGFVTFAVIESAMNVMKSKPNLYLGGYRLDCKYALPKPKHTVKPTQTPKFEVLEQSTPSSKF